MATIGYSFRMEKLENPSNVLPSQQRTLNKLSTELQCRNFVSKHQLSIQNGAKCAKTCKQCVHIPTELCIPPLVVGYVPESISPCVGNKLHSLSLSSHLFRGKGMLKVV